MKLLWCRHSVLTRKFQWESDSDIRVTGLATTRTDTGMAITRTDIIDPIETTAITMALATITTATATIGTIVTITIIDKFEQ